MSEKRKVLKPKTPNQEEYIRTIVENEITICLGLPGTGKSTIGIGLGVDYLFNEKVEKLIIVRPIVECSNKGIGYLPGSAREKISPYMIPIMDELKMYVGDRIRSLIDKEKIEIAPLEFLRGRNLHNAFVILDEAENCTYAQLKMFLTRIGRKSKVVINGDIQQTDLEVRLRGALEECANRLSDVVGVGIVHLKEEDIIRNKLIATIMHKLGDF